MQIFSFNLGISLTPPLSPILFLCYLKVANLPYGSAIKYIPIWRFLTWTYLRNHYNRIRISGSIISICTCFGDALGVLWQPC